MFTYKTTTIKVSLLDAFPTDSIQGNFEVSSRIALLDKKVMKKSDAAGHIVSKFEAVVARVVTSM